MGTPPPIELSEYWLEKAVWINFGLHLADLDAWPQQKLDDYILFLQLEESERRARAARENANQPH